MLRPLSDMIIIERYREISGIELPNSKEFQKGEFFVVKAAGPGYKTDQGATIEQEIKVGDTVALAGKILVIPFKGKEYLIARGGNAIAVAEGLDEKSNTGGATVAGGEQSTLEKDNEKTEPVPQG